MCLSVWLPSSEVSSTDVSLAVSVSLCDSVCGEREDI